MISRLTQKTVLNESVDQTRMRARVVGMDRQHGPPFRNRAVQISLLKQSGAEIVMRIRKVGSQLNRLAKMRDCITKLAFLREHVVGAVMNDRETLIVVAMF